MIIKRTISWAATEADSEMHFLIESVMKLTIMQLYVVGKRKTNTAWYRAWKQLTNSSYKLNRRLGVVRLGKTGIEYR